MVAVELILLPVLIGVCLYAYIALEQARDVIDRMPLPPKPFDGEEDAVWADLEARALVRRG
jgi:hypothetical protein